MEQDQSQRDLERLSLSNPLADEEDDSGASNNIATSSLYEHLRKVTSKDRLKQRKMTSLQSVSSYRIDTENREALRRQQYERQCQERAQAYQQAKETWSRMEEQIASNWDECSYLTSAWETKEALEEQQKCCSELISSKIGLINHYGILGDIHSFSKDQAETVAALRETIEMELSEMQKAFNHELEAVEEAYIDDRARLLESNKEELATLLLTKSNLEAHHIKTKQIRIDGDKSDIDAARKQGAEENAELKTRLEKQVQELEQKLEKAKVSHRLNSDRLDYDLRILTTRNEEAAVTIKKQKKRLVKSKESFNKSREQYWEAEAKGDKKIATLSKDCRVLDTRWKSLRTKARHFDKNEESKYRALLDMHVDDLSVLAQRIKKYEKQIVQSLGRNVTPQSDVGDDSYVHSTSTTNTDNREGELAELSNTVDSTTYRTWTELEKLLLACQDILGKRERRSSEMKSIARDNARIKRRLRDIAQSDSSKELIFPPTLFMEGSGCTSSLGKAARN
mmetsp:Transcript_26299/g.53388  ORF Transcript_26299/g.53388 Transcript_26299/m.53388 type:complete len:509 (-) Transcript_26299:1526-3052(-)